MGFAVEGSGEGNRASQDVSRVLTDYGFTAKGEKSHI